MMRIPLTLTLLLAFPLNLFAEVIYDASVDRKGKAAAVLSRAQGWSIQGTGYYLDDITAIDDDGVPAYLLRDDNLGKDDKTEKDGNGPQANYDYTEAFPDVDFEQDKWYYSVRMRVVAGKNGQRNGAMQVYTGKGRRYLVWVYVNAKGSLMANDQTKNVVWKLAPEAGRYHDFRLQHEGEGEVVFLFNGKKIGKVGSIPGNGTVLTVGSGSGTSTGEVYVNKVEFGYPARVLSQAAAIFSLGDLSLMCQEKKE